jgi:hypothetical protein
VNPVGITILHDDPANNYDDDTEKPSNHLMDGEDPADQPVDMKEDT